MAEKFSVATEIHISAAPAAVWAALTDPDKIRRYLFGTNTVCDWQVGSKITYSGEWQGREYVDKGEILASEPPHLLAMTYWSGFSGLADIPENYQRITYRLEAMKSGTKLAVLQEGLHSIEAREHSQANWKMVLEALKKVVQEG